MNKPLMVRSCGMCGATDCKHMDCFSCGMTYCFECYNQLIQWFSYEDALVKDSTCRWYELRCILCGAWIFDDKSTSFRKAIQWLYWAIYQHLIRGQPM